MDDQKCKDFVRVTGHLGSDAEVLYAPGGKSAVLKLEIEPAKGLPYLVVQNLGEDPSAHLAAKSKARQLLRRGAIVTVYAIHYELHKAQSRTFLRLQGIQNVITHNEEVREAA